jgi:PAS domain S-box-containing protein
MSTAEPGRKRTSVRTRQALFDARWQAILGTARDAIITIDPDGLITLFNPAAEEMFGHAADEILGENVSILMPDPYRSSHDQYIASYRSTGEARAIGRIRHVEGRRKNGERFPIELSVSEASVGDETLYTAIIRDVSVQESLRHELRNERDFARSLIDTAQVVILLLDRHGRVAMYNPYFTALTGFALDEVMGRDWLDVFIPAEARARTRDSFALTLAGRPIAGTVIPVLTKSGETRDVEWHGKILYDDTGGILGVLYSGNDITEHLRTQNAIRARERQQATVATLGRLTLHEPDIGALVEQAATLVRETLGTDFVKILEFDSGQRALRVIAGAGWNNPVIGMVQRIDEAPSHPLEVIEGNDPSFLHELPESVRHAAPLLREHGVVSGLGVAIAGRNGRPFGVIGAYNSTPHLFSDDDVAFLQSVANIIAEAVARGQAEKELLEARRQAQQRDRLADIGAITAKVVHDLGNPLAALSMQAQLLIRRARRGEFSPPEPVIGPAEHCLTTLGRLQGLISEFNDFARDQRLRHSEIRVASMLEGLAALWKPLADARRIEIAVAVAVDLPPLRADEEKLRRVFDNLIKNALDAIEGEDGGDIEISARTSDSEKIRICVADSGSGVSEGIDVFRLFETTKRDGTGIGLAVAKQVIQAHGGRIEHRARHPHGTIFEIELPRSGVPESAVQPLTP